MNNMIKVRSRILSAVGALLYALAASPAWAQLQDGYTAPTPNDGTSYTQVQSTSSANNNVFATLKTRCESDVACGKANGDVCAEAAAVLLGNDPPDNYRDLSSVIKTKIALRLLERGVDSSNLAAARAFDLYDKADVGGFLTGSASDSYRAAELMALMTKRNYPGATLRKARATVSLLSFTSTEADKRQTCNMAKQMLAGGKLDGDSKVVANDILNSSVCKNLAAQDQQPQP